MDKKAGIFVGVKSDNSIELKFVDPNGEVRGVVMDPEIAGMIAVLLTKAIDEVIKARQAGQPSENGGKPHVN